MTKTWFGLALLLLWALAPGPAPAAGPAPDPRGFYLGASLGTSHSNDWCGPYLDVTVITCDNSATGYKLYGGYRFNEFLGVEAGYADLGSFSATLAASYGSINDKIKLRGAIAQAVLHLPITGEFSVFGKGGGIYWDLKSDTYINGVPSNRSGNGLDVALGAGVQYFFTPHFALRAEFEYFPNVGKTDTTGDYDQQLWTIGAVWKF
jgi:OOP family OmpA-OmpF porin